MSGRVWKFGDNVDTDALAPGRYMKGPVGELARHCLETIDPRFAREARPGDIVVGGRNFGVGSSREQAAMALRQLGIAAVLARSFAGIFYRNAINLGLLVLVCPNAERIPAGAMLTLDTARGRAIDAAGGAHYAFEPLPPHLMALVADGGLLPHLEKRLRAERTA
jgi:3-isopropylmalate/(R)-2-methylmalate dehydratase small subunit